MKFPVLIALSIYFLFSCSSKEQPICEVIDEALKHAEEQSLRMAKKLEGDKILLPRSYADGKMITSNSKWWCSGFFPGVLWYLYENNNTPELLAYAKDYTSRVENEKYTTDNHDVGFMLYCSYGNGLRLTGDTAYLEVLHTGTQSLATRYKPSIGLIRSWDFNKDKWQYPVIIDNMMNLELLFWTAKTFNEPTYRDICISHADKTMQHHYRNDHSCFHVVSYDTISGQPHVKQTHQGYSDESSWSRGQAWGLYGYTLMYRETKDKKYLEHAENIANYMIHHPNMPDDYIPYWDYNAPGIPDALRDVSAGTIMLSALMELSEYVDKQLSDEYLKIAEKQIRTLASPEYTAPIGENGDFILMHGVGHLPGNGEVDVPLTYADYYYVEALMRYKKKFCK